METKLEEQDRSLVVTLRSMNDPGIAGNEKSDVTDEKTDNRNEEELKYEDISEENILDRGNHLPVSHNVLWVQGC